MSWLSDDQAELGRVVRALMSKVGDSGTRRELISSIAGFDRDIWRTMAEQVGLQGLTAPEAVGGSEAGVSELCVVLEELGRALYPSPFLSTVVRSQTLLSALSASSDRDSLLSEVIGGERIVALIDGRDGSDATISIVVTSEDDAKWRVSGTARPVLDAGRADVLLVLASGVAGTQLFQVAAEQPALQRTDLHSLDPTRRIGDVVFDGAEAKLVAEGDEVDCSAMHLETTVAIGVAADSVGAAAGALDIAVEYAKTREQFGRPIGSFQALKHMLADAKFDVETSRAAVVHTAAEVDAGRVDLLQVWSTAAYVADAAYRVTATMLQVLGGIGFTQEHDGHFFYKRVIANRQLLGGSDAMLDRVASRLIDDDAMADNIALDFGSKKLESDGEVADVPWLKALEQV